MSNAEPIPTPISEHAIIVEARKKYRDAMAEAIASGVATEAEKWQEIYASHRKAQEKARKSIAENLREWAKIIERNGMDEDMAKALKGEAKLGEEIADADLYFMRCPVGQYRSTVYACEELIRETMDAARSAEQSYPLQTRGLVEAATREITTWPRATWNADLGCVVVG